MALVIAVTAVSGIATYLTVQQERDRLTTDLEHRVWLLAEGLKESTGPLIAEAPSKRLDRIVEKISAGKQVEGIAVFDNSGKPVSLSKGLAGKLPDDLNFILKDHEGETGKGTYEKVDSLPMYIYALPTTIDGNVNTGMVVIFTDISYIEEHISGIWRRNFIRILANALIISVITLVIVRWSIIGPIAQMSEWIKSMHRGKADGLFKLPKEGIFEPISKEISSIVKSLAIARTQVEEEARLRNQADSKWTAERLKLHVREKLQDSKLIVVSNREPYMHVRSGKLIECLSPASGLVTALDPILKACSGLWVAHGSGNADRETVDNKDMVLVPPDNPQYVLKRIWLSQEEEAGYYYGLSNEGLWPLCHIAHTRPTFRIDDWARYQEVNLRFARSLDDEIGKGTYIFIQDYHFSILPRLIKQRHPDAKIALFWHIPWPNPEAFGICPWKREILHGMLGADLIGFHTQYHCNNFLETVDRTLECRTNWENFSTTRSGHSTIVKPFPISVDFSGQPLGPIGQSKEDLLRELGVRASVFGIGVDRLDYTKGIIERLRAVERFIEKNPEYREVFTFVQIGAPSREHIKSYHDFVGEVLSEVDRINWKFQSANWKPIVFLKRHFSHAEIEPFYRHADLCMVTSLHDGMNLVAKEFIASREDEKGALILSTFAGASRELRDAILVNPYDIEQMANSIKTALEMDSSEQIERMRKMREIVRENNIYRWAANIITELTNIRAS
ncbi:MAG: hypothetical protein A2V21_303885 [Deltaproteobacteria bacterium GWC2_55_46]|nr:MAG: hypothetical protein A2Z79_12815 [Deltaproteobacteria bacterium GWA2_55_82]OGQ62824.1 MAG: hypothetical protein A3I81_11585 [Deltaproteobacteria bacterium RIFCSPLOWO2_02_FULL_55_12]OIJ73480.1 MAG: hypothetical protein A2V21_303885 [Deltaproteobacteria bacterium GWC2_55_46]